MWLLKKSQNPLAQIRSHFFLKEAAIKERLLGAIAMLLGTVLLV